MRQTEKTKALEKKLSLDKGTILHPSEVRILSREIRRLVDPIIGESPVGATIKVQDAVRWMSITQRCKEARAERKLGIRHASLALGLPQYRLKAMESGRLSEMVPKTAWRYFTFLGIDAWVRRWCKANPELARRAGSFPINESPAQTGQARNGRSNRRLQPSAAGVTMHRRG